MMLCDKPEEQNVLYREILQRKMTVREAESIARRIATDKVRKKEYLLSPDIIQMERKLTQALGTRVQIEMTNPGGKIHIDYFSESDLRNILEFIKNGYDKDPKINGTNTEVAGSPSVVTAVDTGVVSENVSVPSADLSDASISTEEQKVLQDDVPKEEQKEEETFDLNNFTV